MRFLVVASLLLFSTSVAAQTDATELRWVRARVLSNAAGTIVLQLGDVKQLSVTCDTLCAGAAPGDVVELHYIDRKGTRTARMMFAGNQTAAELSKKPGRSARGVVSRTKKSSVRLQFGTKTRDYTIQKKTTLVEAGQGQPVATGRADVISRLKVGEDLLVKYEEHDTSFQAGEVTLPSTELRAVELRRMQ
jgi:hypothetical protein